MKMMEKKEVQGLYEEGRSLDKWECQACGYVYDPETGDPTQNIKPGTPFEDLPESWVCPVCGAPKNMFKKIN